MSKDVSRRILSSVRRHTGNILGSTEQPKIEASTILVSLDLDSLDLIELVYSLEEEYSISIDPDVLIELATVEDLINCIGSEIIHTTH